MSWIDDYNKPGFTVADAVWQILSGNYDEVTQAEYDAMTPDPSRVYIITEEVGE